MPQIFFEPYADVACCSMLQHDVACSMLWHATVAFEPAGPEIGVLLLQPLCILGLAKIVHCKQQIMSVYKSSETFTMHSCQWANPLMTSLEVDPQDLTRWYVHNFYRLQNWVDLRL